MALAACACDQAADEHDDRDRPAEIGRRSDAVVWGCGRAITELPRHLDAGWREDAIVVGDFGLYGMAGDFHGFRPDRRADIQVKLPVTVEGHSAVEVWIPRDERDRVGLILADVPRRGPRNTYRVEDGHQAVRFEPCRDKEWTAWTAGLALADSGEIVLMVKEDTAARATTVTLGPWQTAAVGRSNPSVEPGGPAAGGSSGAGLRDALPRAARVSATHATTSRRTSGA